jgi:hypothetical protein
MGCIWGPSVANLYVYILEKEWLVLHNNELIYFELMVITRKKTSIARKKDIRKKFHFTCKNFIFIFVHI